jgi:hypothetical protein
MGGMALAAAAVLLLAGQAAEALVTAANLTFTLESPDGTSYPNLDDLLASPNTVIVSDVSQLRELPRYDAARKVLDVPSGGRSAGEPPTAFPAPATVRQNAGWQMPAARDLGTLGWRACGRASRGPGSSCHQDGFRAGAAH